MKVSFSRVRDKLETSVWWVPTGCLFAAVALSFGAEKVDTLISKDLSQSYLFKGGPEGARAVLTTVAGSLMTLTGVVFSVTILVLQLASSQFSPRVLRNFLQDRGNQVVLGIFVGTFLFSLLGLRSVRGDADGYDSHVPALTIWLSVVLGASCIGSFIYFIHNVAQSIRAVNVVRRIGDDARKQLEKGFPEGIGQTEDGAPSALPGAPSSVIPLAGRSGVILGLDRERLVRCACEADAVIRLVPMIGDFVPYGAPLLEVWGTAKGLDVKKAVAAIRIGSERNTRQDVGFAFRELVDVAERALSPGVNDPTTAVQALDQIHDLLRRLVLRRFPNGTYRDACGKLRLVLTEPKWDDFVALALDEIRQYGEGSIQVARRVRFLLEDLLTVAPPARREALLRQEVLLRSSVSRGFTDARDEASASTASPQGHGPH